LRNLFLLFPFQLFSANTQSRQACAVRSKPAAVFPYVARRWAFLGKAGALLDPTPVRLKRPYFLLFPKGTSSFYPKNPLNGDPPVLFPFREFLLVAFGDLEDDVSFVHCHFQNDAS
jgi:hypothetical protein